METLDRLDLYLIVCVLLLLMLFISLRMFGKKNNVRARYMPGKAPQDWPSLQQHIRNVIQDTLYSDLRTFGVSEEEYKRLRNRRTAIKQALSGCTGGQLRDKLFVKQFFFDELTHSFTWDDETFETFMPFSGRERMQAHDQFDILLYIYKKKHGLRALAVMLDNMALSGLKVTAEDVRKLYNRERPLLASSDKLMMVAQKLYQQMLGFGAVDELRDMTLDGISGGVSGMPSIFGQAQSDGESWQGGFDYDSIWIFFRGKSLHMQCLSFGSAEELKRVCQNIYKFNYPGQLSERIGYKVNQMADGSRVVVVRPPFSESWAFFVRKFDVQHVSLEQLIRGDGAEFMIHLLHFLIKGARVTAVTGAQGSGKTTLLMALVKHIDEAYNIRVQEMAFELRLRSLYPNRNILTFRETEEISGQQGLDVQKKTDGTVNIIGEVASDPVAAWMIQAAQVASLFTLFTHHAKTFPDLVFALRNSLLKAGVFSQEKMAEQQVVGVLHFNIHLRRDADGKRYVERVTECVPSSDGGKDSFVHRDVARCQNEIYSPHYAISAAAKRDMLEHMNAAERSEFVQFCAQHWPGGEANETQ